MDRESASSRASRFEFVSVLGKGSSGVVYRAIDRDSGETVAVKTLRSTSAETVALLRHEFRVLQGLRHPNLVEIRDLVHENGEWHLSMEYLDGEDFLRYVQGGAARGSACFDEGRLRQALRDLAAALAALHRAGRIHRDIKPSNVMVTREGRLVVLDFGLARDDRSGGDRVDDGIAGTARYMAPEQVTAENVGVPADWYAVGVVLFHALTGRLPFEGTATQVMEAKVTSAAPDPAALEPGLPADLVALCRELLEPDPERRLVPRHRGRDCGHAATRLAAWAASGG